MRAAVTVVCCDNLPHNGVLVRGLVARAGDARCGAARAVDREHVRFPSTMVDRIVPATTDADIAENDAALGVHDAAPVMHEPFRQWVIEDEFAAGRPAWDAVGAQLVRDVAPFEAMKLRLLNASHSALAYLGYLAGHEFIYQVAAQPDFVAYMRALMRDEVAPTLALPRGVDVAAYQDALVERFAQSGAAASHAADRHGRLAEASATPARHRARQPRGAAIRSTCLALAVAAWMRYVRGVDEAGSRSGSPIRWRRVSRAVAAESGRDPVAYAHGLLALSAIFGDDLPKDARFTAPVIRWLTMLGADGAASTVARAVRP